MYEYFCSGSVYVAVKVRFQPKRVLASQNAFGLESQSKRVLTEIFSQSAFSAKMHLDCNIFITSRPGKIRCHNQ